jgi:hypothetical protein
MNKVNQSRGFQLADISLLAKQSVDNDNSTPMWRRFRRSGKPCCVMRSIGLSEEKGVIQRFGTHRCA